MNKFNLLLIPFFVFSFLLLAHTAKAQTLNPFDLQYMNINQLEGLIVQEQEKIQACRTRATEILNIISDEDNPSSDAIDEIDKNMDCMRTHKANIMLIKKEINKRLTGVSSDNPDRKKLKKAQGQADKAMKQAQDAQTEVRNDMKNR